MKIKKYINQKLAQFKQWILSFVISSCYKDKHIWIKNRLERKCIICKKEEYNLIEIVNGKGRLHGGNFHLRDKYI